MKNFSRIIFIVVVCTLVPTVHDVLSALTPRNLFSLAENQVYLDIEGIRFIVEVADSPETRAQGLMNRSELSPLHGMLFVFEQERMVSFWMKDTEIPLTVAYIDSDGYIVELHELEPYNLTPVPSSQPVRYALEVNRNEFIAFGITVGAKVELPSKIKS